MAYRLPNSRKSKFATAPHVVNPGVEVIDGARFAFRVVKHAETEDALTVALPDERVVIPQDLIYNRIHLFLGERRFDGWTAAIREYKELPYDTVLPGHGLPGGKALYDEMLSYLAFSEVALADAADGEDLKKRLTRRFPDYGGMALLDH
jgi:glyoxylase-like metal-dependent hydrolase (beta-lactamase superfamily II)